MNKQELKDTIRDMLLLEPRDIDELLSEKYNIKETQEIWNNLKEESRELIENYVLGFYYHIWAGINFSNIYDKINNYELKYNDNNDYVDNKGNIKFTSYDNLNINFDSVVNIIVQFEFMNN